MKAALLAVLAIALPCTARGEIYRCRAEGRVTYQEVPCPAAAVAESAGIPTRFPPPNTAERDRLLQREAQLDRRLEARRDRDMREAVLRDAQAQRDHELRLALLARERAQAPLGMVPWPRALGGHGHRGPHRPTPWGAHRHLR